MCRSMEGLGRGVEEGQCGNRTAVLIVGFIVELEDVEDVVLGDEVGLDGGEAVIGELGVDD